MFWDHKGIILIEYLAPGRPLTRQDAVRTLTNWNGRFRIKGVACRRKKSAYRPTIPNLTQPVSRSNSWIRLDGRPSEYHLFTALKVLMGSKKFRTKWRKRWKHWGETFPRKHKKYIEMEGDYAENIFFIEDLRSLAFWKSRA